MQLGGPERLLAGGPSRGARGGRRAQRQVLAAKKDSSPWSTGGPKRGTGGGGAGGGGGAAKGGSGSSGAAGSGKGSKGNSTGGSSSPWKDAPSPRQGLPSKPAKAGSGGAGSRLGSRLAPPPEVTITDPVEVTLLDELTPSERAAEPKWDTFCSHMNGEWVGQYAAYTPWEGKPEPAWLDERGKYINVVYTRALEHRFKYTPQQPPQQQQQQPGEAEVDAESEASAAAPMDVLLRKLGRCTKMAALADLRLPPESAGLGAAGLSSGSGSDGEAAAAVAAESDLDVEALAFNSDGIVVFDGGNYSAGPEFIGQQQVKYVNDEALEALDDERDEEAEAAAEAQEAQSERARSSADASTSAPARGGGAGGAAAGGKGAKAAKAKAAAAKAEVEDEDDGMDEYLDELFGEGEGEDGEDGEDEDGSSMLPTTTSVFEQCLVDWGSRTRMRIKMTLRIGQMDNGEVDVEVLRILLFNEEWLGPATAERLSAPLADVKLLQRPCTDLPRMRPEQMQGAWNVFTVSATGIDEADPFTGEERVVWLYSSTEEQQLWDASAQPPGGDEGGCYWLPGGVVISLRMVDNYVPADAADAQGDSSEDEGAASTAGREAEKRAGQEHAASNGNGNGSGHGAGPREYPRGLCLGMAWAWKEGNVSLVEREYDGYGYLREVRLGQAVKGGWSGGRM
ncbi:hypothetical protein HXX76_006932 [Chlamydomonas incerta]|uniref:Uncharacterized protein n=1 Tax=Chlamydomonas incerta TaxID=51695 RepID=A0A835T1R3_CHLIN|nr:hypothetical protein HXX76_006932 [Chlamydomonas incerta]|eukprot:KAG2435736.1 hypothetical protein HXX76_006932 [Chlamydomonas incerta]